MRILFISAFYPPYLIGGWEQLVRDVNERLQRRGHVTQVLTSTYGVTQATRVAAIERVLQLESGQEHYRPKDSLHNQQRVAHNRAAVRRAIAEFAPDVVFVQVMWNLTHAVPWQAEQLMPGRVVYYVANDWPHALDPHTAYWRDPAVKPLVRRVKQLIAPLPLRYFASVQQRFRPKFDHVLCVSNAVRNALAQRADIAWDKMQVVHNGVDTTRFVPADSAEKPTNPLRLLYAGSLVEHKGVHTIIEALKILQKRQQLGATKLTIVGAGHSEYEARLHKQIAAAGLTDCVALIGRVPREQMPALMQEHDALLVPSIWEEPLARVMQEGMACGLVVIGTLTGGSGELLISADSAGSRQADSAYSQRPATGLTFAPQDASALANCMTRLDADRDLLARLAYNGRHAVVSRFGMTRMVDEVETALVQVTNYVEHAP